jgi:nucleoside 2-deoxyribosyltransferase
MTSPYKFYLAAPFFNPAQARMVERIESLFAQKGVDLFSPRQTDHNRKKELNDQDAIEIFSNNVAGVKTCSHMLAVLDWANLPEIEIWTLKHTLISTCVAPPHVQTEKLGQPLNLPDTGTVWEMGAAFVLEKPIIGFTLRKPGDKVNIMLTQCLRGVIYGFDDLINFLGIAGKIDMSYAQLGVWKHR